MRIWPCSNEHIDNRNWTWFFFCIFLFFYFYFEGKVTSVGGEHGRTGSVLRDHGVKFPKNKLKYYVNF